MASVEEVLEAKPIKTNQDLLNFNVPSRNVIWKDLIEPIRRRGSPRILGSAFKHLSLERDPALNEETMRPSQKVLVCHDLKGNYREDRFYSSSRKWDDYRFYHWAGIDYFCYFSHNYVTIPPAGWTSAAHKHGVVMLGTFIVEGGNCHILNELLGSQKSVDETVDALVHLCDHFCFEGYLLNIECSVNISLVSNLEYFVKRLNDRIHALIPHGRIIWYDSVTSSGSLHHQSELNDRNRLFFDLCDGALINYQWSEYSLRTTAKTISEHYPGQEGKAFMGIDVFGRSQQGKFETYKLLQFLIPYGFSVGLFAIGWTFESLKAHYNLETEQGDEFLNEAFLRNNDTFWDLLWQYLPTKPYAEMPFYSNFCLGSGIHLFGYGMKTGSRFFNLSKQAMQPSVPLYGICERNFMDGLNGGSCLMIKKSNEVIQLFCTEFYVKKSFVFAFASKTFQKESRVECVLQFSVADSLSDTYQLICCERRQSIVQDNRILLPAVEADQTHKVAQYLTQSYTQLKLPFTLADDWQIRYYIAGFNKPIILTDIGVVLNAPFDAEAYLGAVHFHAGDIDVEDFPIIRFNDADNKNII